MTIVRLVHWKKEEAAERADRLRAHGFEVDSEALDGPAALRRLGTRPPDAIVIDLSRQPARSRDVALALRSSPATRHVPLVFVDGDPVKVERIRWHLPDAIFTRWGRIRSALKRAIAHPPKTPVVPGSRLEGYSGTPLPKKLGIKADSTVILVGAPSDFAKTLGRLPDGVVLRRQARGRSDQMIWFPASRADLERRVRRLGSLAGKGGLWIAWPKKVSGVHTDLTQTVVRSVGLAAGLVDYKICSIDATWSGLRFTRRK